MVWLLFLREWCTKPQLNQKALEVLALKAGKPRIELARSGRHHISLVVRVSFGDISFLFTGDAEKKEEEEILKKYEEELRSTVLKAGHHGSDSSSSLDFVQAVSPEYAVICVGEGNEYGLPDYKAMKNLTDSGAALYRTDLHGTVVMRSDGKDIVVETEKEPTESVLSEPTKEWRERTGEKEEEREREEGEEGEEGKAEEPYSYVVNERTRKFHYVWCSAGENISEQNRSEYTGTRDELLEQGYSACGKCQP